MLSRGDTICRRNSMRDIYSGKIGLSQRRVFYCHCRGPHLRGRLRNGTARHDEEMSGCAVVNLESMTLMDLDGQIGLTLNGSRTIVK